jgi:hypothetical protein
LDRELVVSLQTCFATVEDPRIECTKRHKLLDIIIIAICGVICGAEGWVEIEEFGKAKAMWLKELLELPNGIGSHDTFGRVFARLDPKQFEASFFAWVQSLHERITGVIAIDGKTLYHEVKETFVLVQAEQFAHVQHQFHQTVTKGHGRLEIRR